MLLVVVLLVVLSLVVFLRMVALVLVTVVVVVVVVLVVVYNGCVTYSGIGEYSLFTNSFLGGRFGVERRGNCENFVGKTRWLVGSGKSVGEKR